MKARRILGVVGHYYGKSLRAEHSKRKLVQAARPSEFGRAGTPNTHQTHADAQDPQTRKEDEETKEAIEPHGIDGATVKPQVINTLLVTPRGSIYSPRSIRPGLSRIVLFRHASRKLEQRLSCNSLANREWPRLVRLRLAS